MQPAQYIAGTRDAGSIEVERGGYGRPRSPFAVQGAWDCGPGTIAPAEPCSSPSTASVRRRSAVVPTPRSARGERGLSR
jgi:hypothetical protein